MLVGSLGQVDHPDGALIAFDVNDFDLVAVTTGALSWPYTVVPCYSKVLGMPISMFLFCLLVGQSYCLRLIFWGFIHLY